MNETNKRKMVAFKYEPCLYVLVLMALSISGFSQEAPGSQKIKVFILAGQSNMVGWADAGRLTQQDVELLGRAQERVLLAYNGAPAKALDVRILKPESGARKKFNIEASFGPELFFGIDMAARFPGGKFLLIKVSQGGTSLYGSWNPDWSEEKATLMGELNRPKLFFELLNFVDKTLAELDSESYELAGMLWVQGEADSNVAKWGPLPSATYYDNLSNLIARVRQHYDDGQLPFLMLEVGTGEVVAAMKSLSKDLVNVTSIAQSKDRNDENFLRKYRHDRNEGPVEHYNYEGVKRIGLLFSKTYSTEYAFSE